MKILIITIMTIAFLALYGITSYQITYPIFIEDECYYHVHEPSAIVNILFDFPAGNGYHPVPTYWGYLIFGVIGFFSGRFISRRI